MAPVGQRQQMLDELLWDAAQNRTPKAVKLLIGGHNANPNQVSPSGQTLLHQAAQNEQHALEVAKVLIHFKVDVKKTDIYGQTSIFCAARDGNAELCEFLLQHGCAVNHADTNRQTPIFYSVRNGHMAATNVFLKRGADVEIKDDFGVTPIFWAAESGHVDTMKKLIQKGANTKHLSPIGGDLFTSATGEAMNFSVNELGADPRRKLIKNQTNLFVAAKRGDVEKAKVLIETYGLDVNHQDENGQTCLYYAALYGGFPVTQKLVLQFKADVLIKDKNGKTALAFLQQKPKIEQNPQVLKLLANAVKEAQKERAAAAREQKKLPKPARAAAAAKEKKERAAAAKEQKKREQEAKVAKARKDKAHATAAEAQQTRAEAGASQSSQTRKREASSEEDSSSKRLKTGLLKRKPGQAVVYVVG